MMEKAISDPQMACGFEGIVRVDVGMGVCGWMELATCLVSMGNDE